MKTAVRRTLSHWKDQFHSLPHTIECPNLALIGSDLEGEIFVGSGRIVIESLTKLRFVMNGRPRDTRTAIKKLNGADENPYDTHQQFRLRAFDYEDLEWSSWCKSVKLGSHNRHAWQLFGEIGSLIAQDSGYWVSEKASAELTICPAIPLPLSIALETSYVIDGEQVSYSRRPGLHTVELLNTKIQFAADTEADITWVTAETSETLPHPYLENLLCEPLRILLGGYVYPRMVARNKGDGTAEVSIRQAPRHQVPSLIGLCHPFQKPSETSRSFWDAYCSILKMISASKGFEDHPITQIYSELADALHGSQWVLAMTLASSAEALAKRLMKKEDKLTEHSKEEIVALKKHILAHSGDEKLKGRAISSVEYLKNINIRSFLKELSNKGLVKSDHVLVWQKVRNSVMHGNLLEPWSTEERDARTKDMIDLVHDLTWAVIENEQHEI